MFAFFSDCLGCLGSLLVSIVGTVLLILRNARLQLTPTSDL